MNPFYRVDNRLVHGQIVSAWIPHLRLQRFVVVQDGLPTDPLRMQMLRMVIPKEIQFDALSLADAPRWLNAKRFGRDRTMVLIESIADAVRLFEAGHAFPTLNLGNVHHGPGRVAITPAVYLGDAEYADLRTLTRRGVRVEVQSLPSEPITNPVLNS